MEERIKAKFELTDWEEIRKEAHKLIDEKIDYEIKHKNIDEQLIDSSILNVMNCLRLFAREIAENKRISQHLPTDTFGGRLRLLRKKLEMGIYEFTNYVGFTHNEIYWFEVANRAPTSEELIAISQKCNVSIDWLLTGTLF